MANHAFARVTLAVFVIFVVSTGPEKQNPCLLGRFQIRHFCRFRRNPLLAGAKARFTKSPVFVTPHFSVDSYFRASGIDFPRNEWGSQGFSPQILVLRLPLTGVKIPKIRKRGLRSKKTHFPPPQKRVLRVKKSPFLYRALQRKWGFFDSEHPFLWWWEMGVF